MLEFVYLLLSVSLYDKPYMSGSFWVTLIRSDS